MSKETISVEDLGKEYEKHAEIQQHFIDKCKAEIKKAKLDMEFDNINARIWQDYEMTYSECLALKQDFDGVNLNTKINSLRNQIKDFRT